MRIGIDGTTLFNRRGYGRFLRELLPALLHRGPEHEFALFVEEHNRVRLDVPAGYVIVGVPCSVTQSEAASSAGHRPLRDLLRFRRAVFRFAPTVFFFPSVYSWFPLRRGQRNLLGVHDAIAERFPKLCFASRKARLLWHLKVRFALRRATRVLTVSDFAAGEVVRHLRVRRDRLHVAAEAAAPIYGKESTAEEVAVARQKAGIPSGVSYFTYVGGFNPHKRIDVALDALAHLRAEGRDVHLALCGTRTEDGFHDCLAELDDRIARAGLEGAVHWPGFVPDEELRALHGGAVACLLPSECEGFGLPAVEAAAAGAAVIATSESPLPGLLETGGLFCPPGDVPTWTAAMRELLDDRERRLVRARTARERASALSWDRTADAVLQALRETGE